MNEQRRFQPRLNGATILANACRAARTSAQKIINSHSTDESCSQSIGAIFNCSLYYIAAVSGGHYLNRRHSQRLGNDAILQRPHQSRGAMSANYCDLNLGLGMIFPRPARI
jgi:hypothetical protein